MKKLLYILILLTASFFAKAQYPVQQSIGSDSALVTSKGGFKGRIVNWSFADTTAANLQRIKNYPGAQIFTTSDTSLWLRTPQANRWIKPASGSGSISSFNFYTDSSLIICYTDGTCDTIAFENNVFVTQNTFDSTINNITNITVGCNYVFPNGLLVSYDSLLVFDVTAGTANINCNSYTYSDTTLTLANGDATFPRFDVIAVDTNGHIIIIQGTPAADPQIPQTDPASQVSLTAILVAAGATTPSDIVQTIIYDEHNGSDYTFATNGWTNSNAANPDDISNPYHLAKDIAVSNTGTVSLLGAYITLTAPDTLYFNEGYSLLKLFIKLNFAFNANQGLKFTWYFNGSQVSNTVAFINGQLGFDITNTTTYQNITIPFSLFIPTDTAFNQLLIQPVNSAKGFLLDYIQLQEGFGGTDLLGNFIVNQYSNPQLANYWISGNARVDGSITSPTNGRSRTEKFGQNAATSANYTTTIGYGASTAADEATSVGWLASGSGISIGYLSNTNHRSDVAIGGTAGGTGTTQVGRDGNVSANESTGIGTGVVVSGSSGVGIGYLSNVTHIGAIALGHSSASSRNYQFSITPQITSFTFPGISRGVAGYVMTDSLGDGSYWVARPTSGALFARTDARNETAATMRFSTANQVFAIDSVPDFTINLPASGYIFSVTSDYGAADRLYVIDDYSGMSSPIGGDLGSFVKVYDDTILVKPQSLSSKLIIDNIPAGSASDSILVINASEQVKKVASSLYTYTASNGLTMTANNTVLGGTLTGNTTIAGGASYRLLLTGSTDFATGSTLGITNSGSVGIAVQGNTTNGRGIYGVSSTNGVGVYGLSTTGGYGGFFYNTDGAGVYANSTNGLAGQLVTAPASTNTVVNVLKVDRNSAGTPANGIGGSIDYYNQTTTGNTLANQLISKWTDATHATRTSQFIITGVNSATTGDIAYFNGNGMVGIGDATASATRLNVVDNSVGAASIVNISSTSTAAASNLQKGLNVAMSGANSTINQSTYGIYSNNTHTGTGASNYAFYGAASGGGGNNYAFYGQANGSGTGNQFENLGSGDALYASASGVGTAISAQSVGGLIINGGTIPSSTNTIINSVKFARHTSGTAADGMGQSIDLNLEGDNGTIYVANQIISLWSTAANATRVSRMKFTGVDNAVTADKLVIEGDGRIYGTGLHNAAGAVTGTTNQYIASGTFTPTLTGVANVGASTAYLCQWMRVGNVVTVSGKIDIDATTTLTLTQLGISLPIASAFANTRDCGGTGNAGAVAGSAGAISADATNDRAQIDFVPTSVTNDSFYFTFTYLIL